MWVARDKDNNLNLFITRPFYDEDIEKYITYISSKSKFIELDNSLFPELTWEDKPIEVRLTTDENNQAIYDLGYKDAAERALEFVKEHWDEYVLATNEEVMGRPILEIDKDLDFEKDFRKELGI